jgi:hypothetical protein
MKNDGKKYIIICGPQSLISQRGREGGREGERERERERDDELFFLINAKMILF